MIEGIAWGGGNGDGVAEVLVSTDGGKVWQSAELIHEDKNKKNMWEWRHWTFQTDVVVGDFEIYCRCVNGRGETQPQSPWYPKGYLYNGWHKVKIYGEDS